MSKFLVLLSLAVTFFYPSIYAQAKAEETFPFSARVTAEKVNVRAGQSENFEKLDVLNQKDEVVVVGKSYSWYKIRLPRTAKSFIIDKYVDVKGDMAEVTADRVNVRAGADVNRTALAQLAKGTKVRIIEKLEGWYRIEPIDESYGWISEEFLAFKSNVIPSQAAAVVNPPEVVELKPVQPTASSSVSVSEKIVTLKGTLKAPVTQELSVPEYQLLTDDKSVYILQGMEHVLKEFLHSTVQVEGRMKEGLEDPSSRPVVQVSRIQLVL